MTDTKTIDMDDLEPALTAAGIYEWAVRVSYSGRFMYGRTCSGLIGDFDVEQVTRGIDQYCEELREDIDNDEDDEEWDDEEARIERLQSLKGSISQDNMGWDMIVYFPGWAIEK